MVESSPNAYNYCTNYHSVSKNISLPSLVYEKELLVRQWTKYHWEFENFLCQNGVEHVMFAPYHPATNGLVERSVWTFKERMKKLKKGDTQITNN